MKLISVRKGFLADHSSTSYEFLAIDQPLDSKAKAAVSRLSSRVRPTSRRAHFVYNAEGYDIPGGWEPLMKKYYDVMYSESYEWWTLVMAFDCEDKGLIKGLKSCDFSGVDDSGVTAHFAKNRMVISINCRMKNGGPASDQDSDYYDDEDCEDDDSSSDSLLNLLTKVREVIMKGDFRPLEVVWEKYGSGEDDDDDGDENCEREFPCSLKKTKDGASVAKKLKSILGDP